MCLAVPLKIREIDFEKQEALVERDGVSRRARIDLIEDPRVGDFVMVHAGFAIEKVEETQALEDIETYNEFEQAMREVARSVEERAAAKGAGLS